MNELPKWGAGQKKQVVMTNIDLRVFTGKRAGEGTSKVGRRVPRMVDILLGVQQYSGGQLLRRLWAIPQLWHPGPQMALELRLWADLHWRRHDLPAHRERIHDARSHRFMGHHVASHRPAGAIHVLAMIVVKTMKWPPQPSQDACVSTAMRGGLVRGE